MLLSGEPPVAWTGQATIPTGCKPKNGTLCEHAYLRTRRSAEISKAGSDEPALQLHGRRRRRAAPERERVGPGPEGSPTYLEGDHRELTTRKSWINRTWSRTRVGDRQDGLRACVPSRPDGRGVGLGHLDEGLGLAPQDVQAKPHPPVNSGAEGVVSRLVPGG